MNKTNLKENKHLINQQIRNPQVRLIGYYNEPTIVNTIEAQNIANSEGLDLILINNSQDPPIAKIGDYKKFIYETEKAEKERRKNAIKSTLKEIQLSPEIADNDLRTKSRKAIEFLKNGDKVKCSLQLKGRQKSSPERGELTILKFATLVEEFGIPESLPKLESNKWLMILKPKKK